ncbi:MAG: ATP-binding protein [Parvibaculaceae bacterium]|nr:ATP-binding protein [Parvibaculaceae bacterium]
MSPFALLKRYLPQGLYGRSLIIIVTPMVLLQAIVAYVFIERHWQMVTEKLSESVVSETSFLLAEYEQLPMKNAGAHIASIANDKLSLSVAFLPGETLPRTPSSRGTLLDRSLSDELRRQIGRPFWISTVDYEDYVDIRIQLSNGVMRVLALRSRVYATNTHIFIVWMVGASLVLIVVAILFLRNQIRPIERLAAAAEGFGKGREMARFKPAGASEVRRAAAAFLDMKDRIQKQMEQRTQMLNGVSHDLRTPITRFKLQLAMMPDSPEIEDLRADVREMERMLEDYLDFARGHQGEVSEPTDLGDLLRQVQDEIGRGGGKVSLCVEAEDERDMIVSIRRNAFKRALVNIVDNAAKYAEHVWIEAVRRPEGVDIIVDDDGEGIPADELEAVFRPFYRLDAARNLDAGGSGLGLAIARDIARGHGGDIILSASPRGGLRVVISVPV